MTHTLTVSPWLRRVGALASALFIALTAQAASARTLTDMIGRQVTVPDHIERVFGSAPPLNVLLNVVAPEKMIGLSFPVSAAAAPYFDPRLRQLPVVGGVFGMGQHMNPETVMALKPDIVLAWQSPFIDQKRIIDAFEPLGLPVVFIKLDDLADWPAALRFTGSLLGHDMEAQAQYVEQALQRLHAQLDDIPTTQRQRVYYAESPDGLATDCDQSFHTEAIVLAAGNNVYHCQPKSHMGLERISIEQVMAFDPQIIIAQDPAFIASLSGDARWQTVTAVRECKVFAVPRYPHNWLDRPPSVTRALGAQWLASLFYPALYPLDLRAETRKFYKLFYGLDLSDTQLDTLLQ